MQKNKQAFTLVELIVVIIIIAILGTIAFITMQGYSASSRDSVRISDMSKISSSLELFNIDAGKYPDPTEAQPVTFTGGLAWYQGIFGDATFTNVSRLYKIPTDPLTEKEYAYSVLNTKQEFELGSIIEGDELALNTSNEVNAFEKTAKAKITGTYNGVSLRVNANNTSYVLAIPGIITSIDLAIEANRGLEVIMPANEMVLDNYSNLPSNYVGTSYDSNKETTNPDFKIVNNILLYEGDIKNLTPTILVTKLQEAYSGTTITGTDAVAELFQINITSGLQLEKIDSYGKNFINNNLGGSAESRIYNTCEGVAHNTMKSYYSAPSVLFGVSCDTVKKDFICIDGTWSDTPTGANILDYPETECIAEEPLNCTYLTTPINHGDSITVYSQETLVWNGVPNCTDAGIQGIVTCNNGVNEGDTTFTYKTCTKGVATNCEADSSYDLNGHTYNVIQMNHNVSSTPTVDVSENHGTFRYTMNALCDNGIITGNETGPVNISCDTNYTWNSTMCVANIQSTTCGGIIVANATATTATTYTQTWNGTTWTPTTTWGEFQSSCDFNCNANFSWDGIACTSQQQWTGTASTGYLYSNASGISQYPLSCRDLLGNTIFQNSYTGTPWNGTKFNNGVYWIKPLSGSAYKVYCDMTTDGGGWTMVLAQYEGDPVINWNEGIQADYDPSLVTTKGFALNTTQLPDHDQIGLGKDLVATYVDYVNGVYTTGDIAKTLLTSPKTTYQYHIYRNLSSYYERHNPEEPIGAYSAVWSNTLTIDKLGGRSLTWSFASNQSTSVARGYAINGIDYQTTANAFAWTLWVRKLKTIFLILDNGGYRRTNGTYGLSCKDYVSNINYSNEGSGIYWIKPNSDPAFKVYCDMTTDGGGWTLVGKGRENWAWNNSGLGSVSTLVTSPDTNDVAYMPSALVNQILGKSLNTSTDGIRISRYDTLNQEYRWKYTTETSFNWTFDTSYNVNVTLNGVSKGTYNTRDQYLNTLNDCTRIFTRAWVGHNNVKGFSTGEPCLNGWQYGTEGHALPMTKVWVRG